MNRENFETGIRKPGFLSEAIIFLILSVFSSSGVFAQSYEACIDSADYYAGRKRWKEAERFTVRALRLEPANKSNWLLWANLGEIRSRLDDREGALTAYSIGLSQMPESRKMLSARAALYIEENRIEEALDDLNAALKLDSTLEWPRMMRGMIMLGENRLKEAEKDFSLLKSQYPENTHALNGLARIRALEGKPDEAVDLYAQSLAISPDDDVWFYKITLLADGGKLQEASDDLYLAMKQFPRNGNMFLLRAYIHKLRFENEEAEIDRKLALEYGADPSLVESVFHSEKK